MGKDIHDELIAFLRSQLISYVGTKVDQTPHGEKTFYTYKRNNGVIGAQIEFCDGGFGPYRLTATMDRRYVGKLVPPHRTIKEAVKWFQKQERNALALFKNTPFGGYVDEVVFCDFSKPVPPHEPAHAPHKVNDDDITFDTVWDMVTARRPLDGMVLTLVGGTGIVARSVKGHVEIRITQNQAGSFIVRSMRTKSELHYRYNVQSLVDKFFELYARDDAASDRRFSQSHYSHPHPASFSYTQPEYTPHYTPHYYAAPVSFDVPDESISLASSRDPVIIHVND